MYDWQIKSGDHVLVYFLPGGPNVLQGVVQDTAHDTGDCWKIKAEDGAIHYVQHFSEIVRFVR